LTPTAQAVELGSDERVALGHLIASLADNKAALGRRYGEWAVSAPTLESAVAAAAMAQDELGHARATYPLLKQLGLEGRDDAERLEVGDCMPVLAAELPGWAWFVAVNLVVDGMLTAFVRACEESVFVPLAQRARKILQEEGSHAAHARAWARRLASDPARSGELEAALAETWSQAARWAGPAGDPEYARLVPAVVAHGPDRLRDATREQVAAPVPALALSDPLDWAAWSADTRR
jgi:ring-1,2-phenylacetyl-CoA epoxidase subunit PaaC